MSANNYALIMAGGAGTRLWPMSRKSLPKQFQYLLGDQTPFQHMVELTTQVVPIERIFVMAIPEFKELILKQVPELPADNILLEPARRDNGPAITLALLQIEKRDPDATVAILWSDHRISRPGAFKQALDAAFSASADLPNHLVIVGANPTRPDTGMGYIQMGDELGVYNGVRIFNAERFIEKPDQEEAERFASSWGYLWNMGYSIISTAGFFTNFEEVQPDLHAPLAKLREVVGRPEISLDEVAAAYEDFPKISIDYLFTQKLTKLAAVPADMGWSDIGSWQILHDVLAHKKRDRLVSQGPVEIMNSSNSLVYAKDKPIALIGMQDVVVVDTGDAIMVMNLNAPSSLVKELTTKLNTTNPELL